MSFIDEMRNLRENIESGKQVRSQRIKEIREDLTRFIKDASQKRKDLKKMLAQARTAFLGKKGEKS